MGKSLDQVKNQVQRRGWSLANRCCLCQLHKESISYLIFVIEGQAFYGRWSLFFLGVLGASLTSKETFLG